MNMMDRLFELAFAYKKTKLWKKLHESELFAVKFEDGVTGWISILGMTGEHCALILYVGDAGFACLHRLTHSDFSNMSEGELRDLAIRNDCIHCAMEGKDLLFDDELEQIREYVREQGIRVGGKNAYPHFLRYRPNELPWKLTDPQDQAYMVQALEAALEIADVVDGVAGTEEKKALLDATWERYETDPEKIVLLERNGCDFEYSTVEPPTGYVEKYPQPEISNELLIARLKKKKREGKLQADVMHYMEPIQMEDEAPFFPYMVFAMNQLTGKLLETKQVVRLEEEGARILLEDAAQAMIDANFCPKEIQVANECSYQFFEKFCTRMKIRLVKKDSLPELDEAQYGFLSSYQQFQDEEVIDYFVEFLDSLSDEDIKGMPDDIRAQVEGMCRNGLLPDRLIARMNMLLGF